MYTKPATGIRKRRSTRSHVWCSRAQSRKKCFSNASATYRRSHPRQTTQARESEKREWAKLDKRWLSILDWLFRVSHSPLADPAIIRQGRSQITYIYLESTYCGLLFLSFLYLLLLLAELFCTILTMLTRSDSKFTSWVFSLVFCTRYLNFFLDTLPYYRRLLLDRKQFTIVTPNHIEAVEHFTATVHVGRDTEDEGRRLMIAE